MVKDQGLWHGVIVNVKITGDAINLGEGNGIEIPGNITSKASHVKKTIIIEDLTWIFRGESDGNCKHHLTAQWAVIRKNYQYSAHGR